MDDQIQDLEQLKTEHVQKCLLIGEHYYRQAMDQLLIDHLVKEIQAINQKAAQITKKEEKNE